MARAAVKAKQQAKAKAQPAKAARARGRRRRRGASGGNPNEQLFFMRLRRGQRWLYAVLAIVFAATFAGVGVGSGTGGLSDLYSGIFGGGSNAVSKAQSEIKKNPKQGKGYLDLANAYQTKGENTLAIGALNSYLKLKPKNGTVWGELGRLQLNQGQTFATQYQQEQQAAQAADPSQPFLPNGPLGTALGPNPAYQTAAQLATTRTQQLLQEAQTALNAAVSATQKASKLQPNSPTAAQQLATTATNAGDYKVALDAWKHWIKLSPGSPLTSQVKAQMKQLKAAVKAQTPSPSH